MSPTVFLPAGEPIFGRHVSHTTAFMQLPAGKQLAPGTQVVQVRGGWVGQISEVEDMQRVHPAKPSMPQTAHGRIIAIRCDGEAYRYEACGLRRRDRLARPGIPDPKDPIITEEQHPA